MATPVRYNERNIWDSVAEFVPQLFMYYGQQRREDQQAQAQAQMQRIGMWAQELATITDPGARDHHIKNAPPGALEYITWANRPMTEREQLQQRATQSASKELDAYDLARFGGERQVEVPVEQQPNTGLGMGFGGQNMFQSFVEQGMQEGSIPTSYQATERVPPTGDPDPLAAANAYQLMHGAQLPKELIEELVRRELLGRSGSTQVARVAGGLSPHANNVLQESGLQRRWEGEAPVRDSEIYKNQASGRSSLASARSSDALAGRYVEETETERQKRDAGSPYTAAEIARRQAGQTRRANLTTAQMDALLEAEDSIAKLDDLERVASETRGARGTLQGHLSGWMKNTVGVNDQVTELHQLSADIADTLLRARSGAAINEQEFKRLEKLVPKPTDPDRVFDAKLNSFRRGLQRALDSRRVLYGVNGSFRDAFGGQVETDAAAGELSAGEFDYVDGQFVPRN